MALGSWRKLLIYKSINQLLEELASDLEGFLEQRLLNGCILNGCTDEVFKEHLCVFNEVGYISWKKTKSFIQDLCVSGE